MTNSFDQKIYGVEAETEGTVTNAISRTYRVETKDGQNLEIHNNWLTRKIHPLIKEVGMYTRLRLSKLVRLPDAPTKNDHLVYFPDQIWAPTAVLYQPSELEIFLATYADQITKGIITSIPTRYILSPEEAKQLPNGHMTKINDIPPALMPTAPIATKAPRTSYVSQLGQTQMAAGAE